MKRLFTYSIFSAAVLLAVTAEADWRSFFDSAREKISGRGTVAEQDKKLSDEDIGNGLREALAVGAERAIKLLGQRGGFMDDPMVHIPLPGMLDTAAKGLRMIGQDQIVDDVEATINQAAEQAIPQTLDIVKDTVKGMTLKDARAILTGPEDSATRYLQDNAGDSLYEAVRPIIAAATEKSGATAAYKRFVDKSGPRVNKLLTSRNLNLDDYVTRKTLDGLFQKLADEERLIREDPLARSTELLKKVFGS